jgi:3'(2'), 5'-bisphosphate nucleotidase
MSLPDFRSLAFSLLPAVIAAARVEMDYFERGVLVEQKPDQSPVTAADREAEAILVAGIHAALPGVAVVAEESAAQGIIPKIGPPPGGGSGQLFFLVDPLDGTRQFINNNPEFTINIGLIHNSVPIFGLIYAPALDRLFVTIGPDQAAEGHLGAKPSDARLADLKLTAIAARSPNDGGVVALGSRSHGNSATNSFLAKLSVAEVRSVGSSLKFCLIARGEADVYARLGPTCEWDSAAGHAILNAAGGRVEQIDGRPMVYGNAASQFLNPHFVAWGKTA